MSRLLPVLAVGALALAAGCSTMSPEERAMACANTDWYRFGVNDGSLGVPVAERLDRFEDCAEVSQPADTAAYQAGRAEGLKEYCTVQTGYRLGYSGGRYQNVCPPELEPDFLQGYAKGRDDRPSYAVYPSIGIGIGSGGVHSGVGIGVGIGSFYGDCYYRDPFPCGWHRPWGYPFGYRRHPYWW